MVAALKRTGCDPGSAVMLGDTPYDVEAALGAGIRIVGLECGGWGKADLAGASEVYVDPADLLARYDTSTVREGSSGDAIFRLKAEATSGM